MNFMKTIINSIKYWVDRQLENKVDVEEGKALSTNDFTNEEKEKLAGVETGATNTVVDSTLDAESENPVQNKVVKSAIEQVRSEGFSGSWNDLSDKPTIPDPVTDSHINSLIDTKMNSVVKTVNGVEPDTSGNVDIEIPESFSGSWNDLTDKPFEEEVTEEVLLEEMTLNDFSHEGDVSVKTLYGTALNENFPTSGKLKVLWDGVVYECEPYNDYGVPAIGNCSFKNEDAVDTGEPFYICSYGTEVIIYALGEYVPSHTIAVYQTTATVKTLDETFIPDTIARTEDIPTVPDWAKQPTKPEYTAAEVGALPDTYTPPAAPVQSVNGKTGTVNLTAEDVGALPSNTEIPLPGITEEADPTVEAWAKTAVPAEVGQYFRVSSVDENGNVSAVEAVDAPRGREWKLLRSFTLPEDPSADESGIEWNMCDVEGFTDQIAQFWFDADDEGNAFAIRELFVYAYTAYGRAANYFGIADQNGNLGYGNLACNRTMLGSKSELTTFAVYVRAVGTTALSYISCEDNYAGAITSNVHAREDEDITKIGYGSFADQSIHLGSTFEFWGR